MPFLLLGVAGLFGFGYAADKVGEGVNDASSGALKLALAAGAIYYIAKKTGAL